MVLRRDDPGKPKTLVVSGTWPNATVDLPEVELIQTVARRLTEAMEAGGMSAREVERRTGVHRSAVLAITRGDTWSDLLTVARLEEGLGVDLLAPRSER